MPLRNIHLTPQLIRAVRDTVDILAIASEHTQLKKAGRRYVGLCPLHREKTPSFSVDPVQGLFYCFGCGAGGDAIKLHMLLSGDDFPAAIEALALRYGIPLPSRKSRGSGPEEGPNLREALAAAAEFFVAQLQQAALPQEYLAKRRISQELVERFGLGYAPPGWRNLLGALHPRIPLADLEAAGLIARSETGGGEPYDRFRNRLMFPIRTPSGRLVGFGGRTLGDDRAKYLNTSETAEFHKGTLLFGLDLAKRAARETGRILLVEGYFDVLAAVDSGIEWTVAGMGTALTPEQARLLSRYADEVVVGYDGDEAGETAFRRALPILLQEGLGVRRARFGQGEDPDSLRLAAGGGTVAQAVEGAEDGVLLEIARLIPTEVSQEPRLQARAAAAVIPLLQAISDPILRHSYTRLAADRLTVPVGMLWQRLGGRDGRSRGAPNPAAVPAQAGASQENRGVVWSLEEQVLKLLLEGPDAPPSPTELPPAEIFLDPDCRNIYQAYCALYKKERGSRPAARAVRLELTDRESAVDRLARLLHEVSPPPGRVLLHESLEKLRRRWQRRRLQLLVREIHEAQRQGDRVRLEQLLSEKTALSRRFHQGPREEG